VPAAAAAAVAAAAAGLAGLAAAGQTHLEWFARGPLRTTVPSHVGLLVGRSLWLT
jgi:hypothetical protein